MQTLENKIAVVTGAAGSIGAAISRRLAECGATVVLHCSGNRARAEELRRELEWRGARAICVQADFRRLDEVRRLIGDVVQQLGRVDILVNNAGLWDPRPLAEVEEAQAEGMMRVDFLAPLFASQAALPHFPKEGGRIIHLSSGLARHPIPGSGLLSASKAALEALTRSQALEWGARNVTVNAVAPGPTSNETVDGQPEAVRRAIISRTALGRIGRPEDIASVVAFLASDDAGWVTGQVLDVHGGLH